MALTHWISFTLYISQFLSLSFHIGTISHLFTQALRGQLGESELGHPGAHRQRRAVERHGAPRGSGSLPARRHQRLAEAEQRKPTAEGVRLLRLGDVGTGVGEGTQN